MSVEVCGRPGPSPPCLPPSVAQPGVHYISIPEGGRDTLHKHIRTISQLPETPPPPCLPPSAAQPGVHNISIPEGDHDTLHKHIRTISQHEPLSPETPLPPCLPPSAAQPGVHYMRGAMTRHIAQDEPAPNPRNPHPPCLPPSLAQPGVHYISIPEGDHDTLHKQIFPVIKKEVRALEEVSYLKRVWRWLGGGAGG